MRKVVKEFTVYKFEELPEEGKKRALDRYYYINVDHDWWQFIYEDAERIGCKIHEFDIGPRQSCDLRFVLSAKEVAQKILAEHGKDCETYQTAQTFLAADLEEDDDEIEEFRRELAEDYRRILSREYYFLTSDEAIRESLIANEYEFTEDGTIHR